MEVFDDWYVIELICKKVDEAGSQAALAELWGIGGSFMSDMLTGKRRPSPKILALLGLRRAIIRADPSVSTSNNDQEEI